MIAEAVDTLFTLGWAVLAWLTIGTFAAAVGLLAVTAAVAWTVRAVWRAARGIQAPWPRRGAWRRSGAPHSPSRDSRATRALPRASQTPSRPSPTWAHEHDTEEAA